MQPAGAAALCAWAGVATIVAAENSESAITAATGKERRFMAGSRWQ